MSDHNHILHAMHEVAGLGALGADDRDADRLPRRLLVLHPLAAGAESPRRTTSEPLYKFLLNKWYFDEIYDTIFVRPAKWLARFLWKRGDGWLIDGFGPTASRRASLT